MSFRLFISIFVITGTLLPAWGTVYAATPVTDSFALWDGKRRAAVIDLYPEIPGIEGIVITSMIGRSAPDSNGMLRYKLRERAAIYDQTGTLVGVMGEPMTANTALVPDPTDPQFSYDGGAHPTSWLGYDIAVGVGSDEERANGHELVSARFHLEGAEGFSTGWDGQAAKRVLIFGRRVQGGYANDLIPGDGYLWFEKDAFFSYDAATLAFQCKKNVYLMEQGWELDSAKFEDDLSGLGIYLDNSGVGNYLSGIVNGTDRTNLGEIRIMREKKINAKRGKVKYQYYDPYTCDLISEVVIVGPTLRGSWPAP